ncbi:MAG: hypothetical protein AB8E15_07390 [Bdellovibrionales bacterium]
MVDLYSDLQKIGFRVTTNEDKSKDHVDIEKTLVDALYFVDEDSRLLSLIFSWAQVHGSHLIADKFIKYYSIGTKYRGTSPWVIAFSSQMLELKDHRFKKLIKPLDNETWIGGNIQRTALKMDGGIEHLLKLNIMIPKKFIRIRPKDVLSKKELIEINPQYANRFRYGTNWRSEIITLIERGETVPFKIAKELGISPSRVSSVVKDLNLISQVI